MVRDEGERERMRMDVRRREDARDIQDRGKKTLTSKPTATESAGLTRTSKPRSLHLAGWNGNGSQAASLNGATARPRIVASTERLARSFRIASGSMAKTAVQEKVQNLRSKAPLPVGWKPTPTKTSILREAAMQAAKDANLGSSFGKPSKTESPVRGIAANLVRTRSSRSLTASPEKSRLPVMHGASRSFKSRDDGRTQANVDTASSSLASEHQEGENSLFVALKNNLVTADPIFALHSPFGMVRRLQNSTDESHQSSEWSVDTSSQAVRRRSHTPQSPSTKQNEDFSPAHDLQIESSPAKKEDVSPSTDHHRHYPGLTPSPKNRKDQSSTRLLVNSPMELNIKHLPFEAFDSDDDYEQSPQRLLARNGPNSATSLKVVSSKERTEKRDPRAFATSPRVRYNTQTDSSDDVSSLKMKPILTIGRGQQRRHKDESRDSIKSVSWDPAIVAVGRCIGGTDANDSDLPVPTQEPTDPVDFAMKDYLDIVTQSFAKLKKSNPKVITKLLAALRDLSDDESSNTDTEQKRKLRLKAKPASSKLSIDRLATKFGDKTTAATEPLESSEQCSQIQDKLASVIESMQNITLTDDRATDEQEIVEATKKDGRWGEVHPTTLYDKMTRFSPSYKANNPVSGFDATKTPVRVSIRAVSPPDDNAPNSPAWIPAKDEDVALVKDSTLIPPKLNPLAPEFLDFSLIRYAMTDKLQSHGLEVQNSLPPKKSEQSGMTSEQSQSGPNPRGNWKEASCPQVQSSIRPTEEFLNSMELVWINNSQLPKTVGKGQEQDKETPDSESPVDIMSTFTQPQIFTVPPGFIPLVPHPGFLSHMAPYQTTYPQPACLPSSITAVPSASNHLGDHIPSEDEPGRESLLLEAEWSQNLLKSFQAKYPLTGTRASSTAAEVTKDESVKPCLVTPQVVESVPTSEQPSFQQAGFQPRTRRPIVKKSGASLQQLAKKTRASVIQQALEVKILQFKEKKAAETKEIQKKQIEKVEKILPLVRLQMKAKFVNENVAPEVSEGTPLQIWQRAPTGWQGAMDHSSEDPEMTSARHWEAGSMEDDKPTAQTQAATNNPRPAYKDMELVDYDDLSRSSSSTIVANHNMQLPAKPWHRHPLNTQATNIKRDRQQKAEKSANIPQYSSQSLQPWTAAAPERDMKLFRSIFGRLREMSSIDDDRLGQSLNAEELDNIMPKSVGTNNLQDQVLSLKSAWEHVRSTEWQNQFARSQNANPLFSTTKGSEHISFQQLGASVNIPYEASTYSNTGIGSKTSDPWELLTAQQWEYQASGKHRAADSVLQAAETGSDTPFRAPKYLWDFLDLEFKLDDLQNLSSLARASSRSSSSTASEALSDALMDARTRLSLSQAKNKAQGVRSQNLSEATSSTVVSGYTMDNPGVEHQEVHLNFDWVPQRLLSQSTVDLSSDSDYLEMAPSKLKKSGRLLALVEGSAAEDAFALKDQAKNVSSRVV